MNRTTLLIYAYGRNIGLCGIKFTPSSIVLYYICWCENVSRPNYMILFLGCVTMLGFPSLHNWIASASPSDDKQFSMGLPSAWHVLGKWSWLIWWLSENHSFCCLRAIVASGIAECMTVPADYNLMCCWVWVTNGLYLLSCSNSQKLANISPGVSEWRVNWWCWCASTDASKW